MKITIPIEIEMPQKMSEYAKKTSEEYWNLEVQIRFKHFKEEVSEEYKNKVLDEMNHLAKYINKVKTNKIGFNVYFSNISVVNAISKLYKKKYFVEVKKAKKIMGKNNLTTKDLYRHFLLVNIIGIKRGDTIHIKGVEYFVKNVRKTIIDLRDLKGNKYQFTYSKICDYLVV
jgi:NMD protein affecting ribosome stability and mRNA decay